MGNINAAVRKALAYAKSRKRQPLFWLTCIYVVGLAYLFVFERIFWTPDILFLLVFVLFLLLGQGKKFFIAFAPFVLLLLVYDGFRGFADSLGSRVHYMEMIHVDEWLGAGTLPTVWLQRLLYHGGVQWYDFYFYLTYMAHFLVPLGVGIYFWKTNLPLYKRYVVAFVGLSFAGFLTYALFPAAPPWMAAEYGLTPDLHKISTDIWWSLGVHDFPSVYRQINPNEVAAVPSLHAAYPLLATMFIARLGKWKVTAAFAFYTLSVWFGVVYMGEHYVIDVILGAIYAVGAYYLALLGAQAYRQQRHKRRLRTEVKRSQRKTTSPRMVSHIKLKK